MSHERKRTIQDKLICFFNSLRFCITESIKLRIARAKYDHLYEKDHERPLISVYVPTYNRGQILFERAVSSVLSQTYDNFEFIIIGDHCTDNTTELVSKIGDRRIRGIGICF